VKFAKETWPLLHMLLPHLGQSAAWAGVDATQQETSGGHVSLRELLLSAGLAGAGSAMGARSLPVAKAFFGRQTAQQMLTDGVDLAGQEGADLGHTLAKHVSVSDADLRARIQLEGRKWASRFYDAPTATRAIDEVLCANRDLVQRFANSRLSDLRLRATLPNPVGVVMDRSLTLHPATQVVVRLTRDNDGIFILTAYPELPKP
jgi:hypothetical protein